MNTPELLFPALRSWMDEDHEGRVMTLVEDGSFHLDVKDALTALDAALATLEAIAQNGSEPRDRVTAEAGIRRVRSIAHAE